MNFRSLRDDQRGGSTIEWLAVGVVVIALILALVGVAPRLGASVRDAVEILICRAVSLVTGGDCAAPDPGPEVPPNGEPDQPPVPPPVAQPGLDECVPYFEERYDQLTVEALGFPYPYVGGHLAGRYWTFKEQHADGKWEVTPIWYGDLSGMVGTFPDNAFAGPYGMDGQTWVVDTEEQADAIAHAQRFRPHRHIPGAEWFQGVVPSLGLADQALEWLGVVEGGYGPPQREFFDAGNTVGFELGQPIPNRGLGKYGDLGVGLTGQMWRGARVLSDPAEGELTYYVSLKGETRGNIDLGYPGRAMPALGSSKLTSGIFGQGEITLRTGLVQDTETGEFTHVDVTYWVLETGGLGAAGRGTPQRPRGRVSGGARSQTGERTLVHGRLPLEGLDPEDRENAIAWMRALYDASNPEEIETALAQQELGRLFDETGAATVTAQHYEVDGSRFEADVQLGPPQAGAAVDPRRDIRSHHLDDAKFWVDGVGWVDWSDCHA